MITIFQCALCFYESLPKIERENRTCQRTNADQGRRKFRKGSDNDAVGQFVEETVAFFSDKGRHVPSEILAERDAYVPHHGARKCRVLTESNVGRSKS